MSVTPINSHVADAIARILEQYKNSPRLKAIIQGLAGEIQNLENSFQGIDFIRSISDATGKNLDLIGAIAGVTRASDTPDDIFRILIIGKITANVSQGETESVIATYQLLTQATEVTLDELYPAGIRISSNGSVDPSLAPYISLYLKQAVAAGVSIEIFGVYSAEDPFGFATDPDAVGFGDSNDPTIGGQLATQF